MAKKKNWPSSSERRRRPAAGESASPITVGKYNYIKNEQVNKCAETKKREQARGSTTNEEEEPVTALTLKAK